jgi:hypothetical protein
MIRQAMVFWVGMATGPMQAVERFVLNQRQ